MEDILAQEINNVKKLQELEIRRNEIGKKYNKKYNSIKDIPQPNDSNSLAKNSQEIAHRRNVEFLQELEISIGKLHTKRLCPINEKLNELKHDFLKSQKLLKHGHGHGHGHDKRK